MKPGSTLVLGETDPDLARSSSRGSRRRSWSATATSESRATGSRTVGGSSASRRPSARYTDVLLSLHGAHQADNAAIALAAAEAFLGRPLGARDRRRGLRRSARSPGRLEVVGHQPLVLLDGAHNVAGAHALAAALRDEFPSAPRTLVIGLLREKDPREMLEAFGVDVVRAPRLLPAAEPACPRTRGCCRCGDRSSASTPSGCRSSTSSPTRCARDALARRQADEQVVVTGSLYVVGAARLRSVRTRTRRRVACRRPMSESTGRSCSASPMRSSAASSARSSRRLERKGLRLVAMELRQIDTELAGRHYDEHRDKPFFGELVTFITRGPLVAMVVEGGPDTWKVVRGLMGATNPREAAPGTIRGDLALETGRTSCTAPTARSRPSARSRSSSPTS